MGEARHDTMLPSISSFPSELSLTPRRALWFYCEPSLPFTFPSWWFWSLLQSNISSLLIVTFMTELWVPSVFPLFLDLWLYFPLFLHCTILFCGNKCYSRTVWWKVWPFQHDTNQNCGFANFFSCTVGGVYTLAIVFWSFGFSLKLSVMSQSWKYTTQNRNIPNLEPQPHSSYSRKHEKLRPSHTRPLNINFKHSTQLNGLGFHWTQMYFTWCFSVEG